AIQKRFVPIDEIQGSFVQKNQSFTLCGLNFIGKYARQIIFWIVTLHKIPQTYRKKAQKAKGQNSTNQTRKSRRSGKAILNVVRNKEKENGTENINISWTKGEILNDEKKVENNQHHTASGQKKFPDAKFSGQNCSDYKYQSARIPTGKPAVQSKHMIRRVLQSSSRRMDLSFEGPSETI